MRNEHGITLTELLVALGIFSVVMGTVFGIYITIVKHSTTEFRIAESEMELEIAKTIIERDIMMAGYGMANDYGEISIDPLPVSAEDAVSLSHFDILSLRGTAIGILSRGAQGWSYIMEEGPPPEFQQWSNKFENIESGDKVIYLEPNTKTLLSSGTTGIFSYPDAPPSAAKGTLAYGIHSENASLPYYAVQYLLGGSPPSICAPGTLNLLRGESKENDPPLPSNRRPLLNCVRDLQVAFGIDSDENGTIDMWDPVEAGNFQVNSYSKKLMKKRLKQIRMYILVQLGNRDPDFMYSNPENPASPDSIRVGDSSLGTGRDITLTTDQRRFRWRLLALHVVPKNLI